VAILSGAPSLLAYTGAVIASGAVSTVRPAQAALIPTLARTTDELTASNVAISAVEAIAVAGAGILTAALLTRGPGEVFAVGVILIIGTALAVAPLPAVALAGADDSAPIAAWADVVDGTRALRDSPGARTLIALLTTQDIVLGALDVLFVVLAVSVLHRDPAWVGYLNTAFGVGGILASAGTALLIGRRLPGPILAGAVAVGATLGLTGLTHSVSAVVLLLVLMGAARSVFDLATRTLLQRSVPAEVVGRVFGLVEGLSMAGLGVGSLAVSVLVALGGPRAALIGVGAALPIVALTSARWLLALDRDNRVPIVEIGLLRSLDLFAPLPPPAIEAVARALVSRPLASGQTLIAEGDHGEEYYAVADGDLEVIRRGIKVRNVGRGGGVGEIALLRSVPRTATVVATVDSLVYALDRESFLIAITGHSPTRAAAGSRIDGILRADEALQG
jgi:hypothetical protein